ncbi:MAG: hypothetical protein NDJ90_01025 [Oligoflexia bacterium]|nr:hypothetical protein [Oligoflexia bacterium]
MSLLNFVFSLAVLLLWFGPALIAAAIGISYLYKRFVAQRVALTSGKEPLQRTTAI